MSSPVLSVSVDTRLGDALEAMVRTGRRHLVVVDTAGRCAGVLADRAVAAAWAHDHAALTRLTVAQALDPDPAVVNSHAKVVDAARLMRARGVDAVAVLNPDGLPMGIVTGSDLIALLAG
ncbi:CBS domain-containing protein [Micromonospora lutea]|nr:CBS domain-containing protein [Micromonospora lutea]